MGLISLTCLQHVLPTGRDQRAYLILYPSSVGNSRVPGILNAVAMYGTYRRRLTDIGII
jgi:hypothetical protein